MTDIEFGQAPDQRFIEGVALEPGLHGATEVGFGQVPHLPCGFTGPFQAVVGTINIGLLCSEFGVLSTHFG